MPGVVVGRNRVFNKIANGEADIVRGGADDDQAEIDGLDLVAEVELILP